jgi:hypothetical protein
MSDCITALLAQARAARDRALALGCYDKTDARDAEPHLVPRPSPSERTAPVRRHDPDDPAWRVMLAQLGMSIDERGRYWVARPPACEHPPHERNTGRDQLTCDGCRRSA